MDRDGGISVEPKIDICETCRFGVQNYVSIIGTIPWCCQKHWHCKPGRLASDYVPKPEPKFDFGDKEAEAALEARDAE